MARIHAFEFEDQVWFPGLIRQYMTDFLSFMGAWSPLPYVPFTERLAESLRATGDARLVDLCSGGGGPAVIIAGDVSQRLGRPLALVLTDLYPTPSRLEHARRVLPTWVELEERSVDMRDVPGDLAGFRLICNGFHHLRPDQARDCLRDAVEQRRGVAVVELAQRSPFSIAQIVLGVVWQLLITPFIKPFRWSRLVFTYAVPVVPVCTLWDGVVSCLRVYDPEELRGLIAELPKNSQNSYDWQCARVAVPRLPAHLTYLIGVPKKEPV
jgi:hypothetical protein